MKTKNTIYKNFQDAVEVMIVEKIIMLNIYIRK